VGGGGGERGEPPPGGPRPLCAPPGTAGDILRAARVADAKRFQGGLGGAGDCPTDLERRPADRADVSF